MQRRLKREMKTIAVMINLYCEKHHSPQGLRCVECEALYGYSMKRIEHCKFKQDKPACAQCSIHCYNPKMKEQVKKVMRYAGPKMIYRHPLLAALHLVDSVKSHKLEW